MRAPQYVRSPEDLGLPPWFAESVIPEPNTGCWIWIASIDEHGYPQRGRSRPQIHRLVVSLLEPLVDGLTIDHLCELRCCVNPAHLEQVTKAENTHRRQARTFTCHRGHILTADRVSWKSRITDAGNPRNERVCLECHADRNRIYRDEKRAEVVS